MPPRPRRCGRPGRCSALPFRSVAGATNEMARDFLAAFAQARTNFMADLVIEFHSVPLTEAIIASPDFSRIVTVYDAGNQELSHTG